MKHNLQTIQIEDKFIPYKWQEHLIASGERGGVMLIFLEGDTKKEISCKVKKIKKFCKSLKFTLRK